jgi:DtxR family Mn-dependent transcriptional regulator
MRKKTIEDYVELVRDLQKGKKRVHTNDIATALKINPASVTEILQKLSDEGYINYEKYLGATLTDKGKKIAKEIKNRHVMIREFLLILGVDKTIAEEDACELEHILHPSTMDIIVKFVDVVHACGIAPFWLKRLKKYVKTGKLLKCPPELVYICNKWSKTLK